MANEHQLNILRQGAATWKQWRKENPEIFPDLREANLSQVDLVEADLADVDLVDADLTGADLSRADIARANLTGADLTGAYLTGANIRQANLGETVLFSADLARADFREASLYRTNLIKAVLSEANLVEVDLTEANLTLASLYRANLTGARLTRAYLIETDLTEATLIGADLTEADMTEANLTNANLTKANLVAASLINSRLSNANLSLARLVNTNLENANLDGCTVYGISAWDLQLSGTNQSRLVITRLEDPIITVDNLEVAQFIYLLLTNEKIRDIIDATARKVVLILGRFTPERKDVLETIRDELRKYDYLSILFDFEKPGTRDTHETVTTLARLARFIIADITDPRSIPQELVSIVETLPSVPVQPILKRGRDPWGMYDHIRRYPWVLPIHLYSDLNSLLASLPDRVVAPAEAKARELGR